MPSRVIFFPIYKSPSIWAIKKTIHSDYDCVINALQVLFPELISNEVGDILRSIQCVKYNNGFLMTEIETIFKILLKKQNLFFNIYDSYVMWGDAIKNIPDNTMVFVGTESHNNVKHVFLICKFGSIFYKIEHLNGYMNYIILKDSSLSGYFRYYLLCEYY